MSQAYNWDAWQTTFALSLLANSASDTKVAASSAQDAETQLTTLLSTGISTGISTYLNGDWAVTWGPAVFVDSGQTSPYNATNAAYVAYNQQNGRYVLAIAATDPISNYDWSQEDFNITPAVAWNDALKTWTGTKGTDSSAGFLTTATVNGVANVLKLSAGGHTLLDYLKSLTLSGQETITVTGHSLAGALSPVVALGLIKGLRTTALSSDVVTAYPTAGATPGDLTFASFYSDTLKPITGTGASASASPWQVWNVDQWNQFDVVPSAWQVDTINLIVSDYQQPKNASGKAEYGLLDIAALKVLAGIAETKTTLFAAEAGDGVGRLAPAFVTGTDSAGEAWTAWPGCLNGAATAQETFAWSVTQNQTTEVLQWSQMTAAQQQLATPLSPQKQVGFQHVSHYEQLILGSVIFSLSSSSS